MRTEQELLVDCVQRLNRLDRPYMVVGSMASNFWGIPRSTHDLDFVIVLEPWDVDPLVSEFESEYFLQKESVKSAFHPPYQFNAIDELSALKVDFWMLREEPFEQVAFERRVNVGLLGTIAWMTTPEDVILHKFHWHRISPSDRQLFDAAGVYAVQKGKLDEQYMRSWAERLDVVAELDDLFSGKLKPKST